MPTLANLEQKKNEKYSGSNRRLQQKLVRMVMMLTALLRHDLWGTHHKPPVLHAFGADQTVGKPLDISRFPAKYHDLQAILMVKMGVQGRNNQVVALMLQVDQLLWKKPGVMIVDQGDGANHE